MNPPTQVVDDQFLAAMGLEGLDDEQKQEALDDILYTLNVNVAKRVADQLNEDQVDEFEKLTSGDSPNDDELAKWLEVNVPNYLQLIEEEAQIMKNETMSIVDKVMSGGQTQA